MSLDLADQETCNIVAIMASFSPLPELNGDIFQDLICLHWSSIVVGERSEVDEFPSSCPAHTGGCVLNPGAVLTHIQSHTADQNYQSQKMRSKRSHGQL